MTEVFPHNMMSYVYWQTTKHEKSDDRMIVASMQGDIVAAVRMPEDVPELLFRIAIDRIENFFWMMARAGIFIEEQERK